VGPGLLATMVVASAVLGFLGLMAGRAGADHFGRRPVIAVAASAMTIAAVITYGGNRIFLIIGYLGAIAAAGAIAPAGAAFANELFPTRDRGAVAGWNLAAGVLGGIAGLLAFGSLADHANSFTTAAAVTFIPFLAAQALLLALPETKGVEPEELWGRS
jgi:MFS family permease